MSKHLKHKPTGPFHWDGQREHAAEVARTFAKASIHGWVRNNVPNGTNWRDANPPPQVLAAFETAYENRIVAQSLRAPVVRNVQIVVTGVDALGRTVSETIEPEGWDMDGLGR